MQSFEISKLLVLETALQTLIDDAMGMTPQPVRDDVAVAILSEARLVIGQLAVSDDTELV